MDVRSLKGGYFVLRINRLSLIFSLPTPFVHPILHSHTSRGHRHSIVPIPNVGLWMTTLGVSSDRCAGCSQVLGSLDIAVLSFYTNLYWVLNCCGAGCA
jgi:hypothetical protein